MHSDERKSRAAEALEQADAMALKQYFDDAEHEIDMLIQSLSIMLDNKKLAPRPDGAVVAAMRISSPVPVKRSLQLNLLTSAPSPSRRTTSPIERRHRLPLLPSPALSCF